MTESSQQNILCGKPKFLSTESYGLALIGVCALFYSVMGAFVKLITITGFPSTEIVFFRTIYQGSLVVSAMLWYRELPTSYPQQQQQQSQDNDNDDDNDVYRVGVPRLLIFAPLGNERIRPIVVARGAVGGAGFVLYFFTVSCLPLGDAVALLSLSPVVTVWASALFAGDPIRPLHIAAAGFTVIGSFLIARPDFLFGPSSSAEDNNHHLSGYNPLGYFTAIAGCLCGAGIYLLMRKAGKIGAHTLQLVSSWVVFSLLFSFILGVVLPLLEGKWTWALPDSSLIWGYILGCCFFGTVAHFLFNFAARHSNPGLASIVRSSGILWAYLLQIVLFDQIPTLLTSAGVIFVGLSLTMVSIQKMMDSPKEENKAEQDEQANLVSTDDAQQQQQRRYGTLA